ncbi:MAG: InlB B-repeat-containing protein [Erysipelotrichaceae bacterium]|nr:InlB B-repeat-containing protein [Erysipelotrichaceae bacterium]
MRKEIFNRTKKGFTLAEVMIVIAITIILSGLGTVEVIRYQRRLKLLEADEIAKEIFLAAQNHLTASWANGEWDNVNNTKTDSYFGNNNGDINGFLSAEDKEDHSFFYISNYNNGSDNVLSDVILPFGSIDDTVRSGGTYIIDYDRVTATVYDVYFYEGSAKLDDHVGNIKQFLLDKNTGERIKYAVNHVNNNMPLYIGYYGRARVPKVPADNLSNPIVIPHNEENLWIEVLDLSKTSKNNELSITYQGDISCKEITMKIPTTDHVKAEYYSDYANEEKRIESSLLAKYEDTDKGRIYYILLDSLTLDYQNNSDAYGQFAKHFGQFGFISGEDITIVAHLTNPEGEVFDSDKWIDEQGNEVEGICTVNSLFAGIDDQGGGDYVAEIGNARHLQNLSVDASGIDYKKHTGVTKSFNLSGAKLINDIYWETFGNHLGYIEKVQHCPDTISDNLCFKWKKETTFRIDNGDLSSEMGTFKPITSNYTKDNYSGYAEFRVNNIFTLDGQEHGIYNLTVFRKDTDLGIFSQHRQGKLIINNLNVINPSVKANRGNAGTLVGKTQNAGGLIVDNCHVYMSDRDAYYSGTYNINIHSLNDPNGRGVSLTSDNTGNYGNIGGLVGSALNSSITITNSSASVPVRAFNMNNQSNGVGGLIGYANNSARISNCYVGGFARNTKERYVDYDPESVNIYVYAEKVNNLKVGGFIGWSNSNNVVISDCYSTASVYGNNNTGGFVGHFGSGKIINSYSTGRVFYDNSRATSVGAFVGNGNLNINQEGNENRYFDYSEYKINLPNNVFYATVDKSNAVATLSKDLEYNVNSPAKPYNTVLGNKYPFREQPNGQIHYGDWPNPKTKQQIVPVEDGNKLAIHFVVDKSQRYATIKVTGVISGKSRYINLYRDVSGELYGLNGTPFTKGNVTDPNDSIFTTLFKHGYTTVDDDGNYVYTIWLDDPTIKQGSFAYLFCNWDGEKLYAGEDIKIYVWEGLKEDTESNPACDPDKPHGVTNSLYAYNPNKPNQEHVYINSGRHLLNLDPWYAGINNSQYTSMNDAEHGGMVVRFAHQIADIQWTSDEHSGNLTHRKYASYIDEVQENARTMGMTDLIGRTRPWGEFDSDPNKVNHFQPIENEYLESYDAGIYDENGNVVGTYVLDSLRIYEARSGGASSIFSQGNTRLSTISNLTVNNIIVDTTQEASALVCRVGHDLSIDNVHVTGDYSAFNGGSNYAGAFIASSNNHNLTMNNVSVEGNHIVIQSAQGSGGLIGSFAGGRLSINGALIKGDDLIVRNNTQNYAGGLVGAASITDGSLIQNVEISGYSLKVESISDAGGLIGSLSGSPLTVENVSLSGSALSIKSTAANATGGLFGTATSSLSLNNIEIKGDNLSISSNGAVGGVAGNVSGSVTVNNTSISGANLRMVSDNSHAGGLFGIESSSKEITNAVVAGNNLKIYGKITSGGLIGQSGSDLKIRNSMSSAYVRGSSSWQGSGGFVGSHSGGNVLIENSYVAGHTSYGSYIDTITDNITGRYNVITESDNGYTGGLIGNISGTNNAIINNSYSTASVYALNGFAGGLIGYDGTNNLAITNAYATGLIKSDKENSFGTLIGTSNNNPLGENVFCLDTINSGMKVIGNKDDSFDHDKYRANQNTEVANNPFRIPEGAEQPAHPFTSGLSNLYPFKKVVSLSYENSPFDHIGDWPSPVQATIRFNLNGIGTYVNGSQEMAITDRYVGETVNYLPAEDVIEAEGYTLYGWFTASVGGDQVNSDTVISQNEITYYAHWMQNVYYENDTFTPEKDGVYLFKAYGSTATETGKVDYTSGILYLNTTDTIYIHVGQNGDSSDIRLISGRGFNSLRSRLMVASGSDANSGYFSGDEAGERNSYISGFETSNAIASCSLENDVIFSGQNIDSSGWVFAEPTIEKEVDGSKTGEVHIYRMIMGSNDQDDPSFANGQFGGHVFDVSSSSPEVLYNDLTVEKNDTLTLPQIVQAADFSIRINTAVQLRNIEGSDPAESMVSPVAYKEEAEKTKVLSYSLLSDVALSEQGLTDGLYSVSGDNYTFLAEDRTVENNSVSYREQQYTFNIDIVKESLTFEFESYYNGNLIPNSSGSSAITSEISAKDASVPAYNVVSEKGSDVGNEWNKCRFDRAEISVNGSNYEALDKISARSFNDGRAISKGDTVKVRFHFTMMSNVSYSASPERLEGDVGESGKFIVTASDGTYSYNVTSAVRLSVDDSSVASIDKDGTVHYLSEGVTFAKALVYENSFICSIFVKNDDAQDYPADSVNRIEFENDTVNLRAESLPKDYEAITVIGTYKSGITSTVTHLAIWESSAENVLTIDAQGNIHALAEGSSTVTVTVNGKQASCTVVVSVDETIENNVKVYEESDKGNYVKGKTYIYKGNAYYIVQNANLKPDELSTDYQVVIATGIVIQNGKITTSNKSGDYYKTDGWTRYEIPKGTVFTFLKDGKEYTLICISNSGNFQESSFLDDDYFAVLYEKTAVLSSGRSLMSLSPKNNILMNIVPSSLSLTNFDDLLLNDDEEKKETNVCTIVTDTDALTFFIGQKDAALPYIMMINGDNRTRLDPTEYKWISSDDDVISYSYGKLSINRVGEAELTAEIKGKEVSVGVTVAENPELSGFYIKGDKYQVEKNEYVTQKWPSVKPSGLTRDTVYVEGNRIVDESGTYYYITQGFEASWNELVGNIGRYASEKDEDGQYYVVRLPKSLFLTSDDFDENGNPINELHIGDVYVDGETVYVLVQEDEKRSPVEPTGNSDCWEKLKDYDPGADTGPTSDALSYPDSMYNPYPGSLNTNCTWAVWYLANVNTGARLPNWGDAGNWYRRAGISGYNTGAKPAKNSILVMDHHVAYVTDVSEDGSQIYVKEGNIQGKYSEGWWTIDSSRLGMKVYGYIYLINDEGETVEAIVVTLESGRHDTLDEFKAYLEELDLELGDGEEVYDDEVAEGHIVSYRSGEVEKGSLINYKISKGPKPVKVTEIDESYIGKSEDEFVAYLRENGLETGTVTTVEGDEDGIVASIKTGTYSETEKVDFSVTKKKTEETPTDAETAAEDTDPTADLLKNTKGMSEDKFLEYLKENDLTAAEPELVETEDQVLISTIDNARIGEDGKVHYVVYILKSVDDNIEEVVADPRQIQKEDEETSINDEPVDSNKDQSTSNNPVEKPDNNDGSSGQGEVVPQSEPEEKVEEVEETVSDTQTIPDEQPGEVAEEVQESPGE